MAAADPRAEMLSEMSQCAYRLGMAFGAEAERAPGLAKKLEWFQLFDRCFFSLRVSTALELRLKREVARPRHEAASDREDLGDREALAERDRPERYDCERYDRERDRERDRETERASFPILIRALEGVAAAAADLPGPKPAALATLNELLAKVKSQPQGATAGNLHARLAAPGAGPAPPRRPASNVGQVLAARRATGPPGR
jgi:hypothetical protein